MNIHHVFSLAPHLAKGGDYRNYRNSTTEKLVQLISIAAWKRHHPNAKAIIYADTAAAKWLEINQLHSFYDEVNTHALDQMPAIDHLSFWAAGKIYAYEAALRREPQPIFIDTDAVLWNNLQDWNLTEDLVVAHWEKYQPAEDFQLRQLDTPKDYQYPAWTTLLQQGQCPQINASFLWFRNATLTHLYLEEAKRFMEHNPIRNAARLPHWAHMCFAEQVLLADAARALSKKIAVLGDLYTSNLEQRFSHLWGIKTQLREDVLFQAAFETKCSEIILRDYPLFEPVLHAIRKTVSKH
jgi:hypothetical protein